MTRLVQLQSGAARRVARVEEPSLRLLGTGESVYALAMEAAATSTPLTALVERQATGECLDYDAVYAGTSPWRLLSPVDHPSEPARCRVSGTGLTHLGSAKHRDAMHGALRPPRQARGRQAQGDAQLTDSMRMFQLGLTDGRPEPGRVGAAPEWFFKGDGSIMRAPGEALTVPPFAGDGGEEAEIAGVYVIDAAGHPRRIGMTIGNEFSDHVFEKTNYLNLAGSKLRTCAIGPEVVIDPEFQSVAGHVAIERAGRVIWAKDIATGSAEMCHSLANIEHHHFKFGAHRRPGDLHVHYYGAHSLSFGDGVHLVDGDVMVIQFAGFGRALRNPVRVERAGLTPMVVEPLL